MCSERWLEEREFQFDLANLNTKRNSDLAAALAMISIGVAFIAIYYPLDQSFNRSMLILSSLFLFGISIIKVNNSRKENNEEKGRIKEKYILRYGNKPDELNKTVQIIVLKCLMSLTIIKGEKISLLLS